ncbi:hypothetical protein ACWEQC_43710 [Streptomyces shenzhenensis]
MRTHELARTGIQVSPCCPGTHRPRVRDHARPELRRRPVGERGAVT